MSTNGDGAPPAPGGRTGGTVFGGRPVKAKPLIASIGVDILIVVAVVLIVNVALGVDSALLTGAISGAVVGLASGAIYRALYDRMVGA